MSLASLSSSGSSQRNAIYNTFKVVCQSAQQTRAVHATAIAAIQATESRSAAQKAPTVKKQQSIGGVKKGRADREAKKILQEKVHRSFDGRVFARMSESRLRSPKLTKDGPAPIDPLFHPGLFQLKALGLKAPKDLDDLPAPEFNKLPNFNVSPEAVGTVQAFNNVPKIAPKVFGLPKSMELEYRIMSQHASVVRDITVSTVDTLTAAANESSADNRYVLTGRAGSGKSNVLHQAVQHASRNGWIVWYVPRAVKLVNSTTTYVYDLRTQTYLQPAAAYHVVQKMLKANKAAFDQLKLTNAFVSDKYQVEAGKSLTDLALQCVKDKSHQTAAPVLEALMKELEVQKDFPVLLAIDDFQSFFHKSLYKDPFFQPIKSFHLSMPRLLMEFASGKRNFARGAVMTSLTASDTTFHIPLEMRDTLDLGYMHPPSPYEKRSSELLEYLKGLKKLEVPDRLTVKEASALFTFWKEDMALASKSYDELFLSKYVESDGNPRDFVSKGLMATLST